LFFLYDILPVGSKKGFSYEVDPWELSSLG
jgi:hypothetical protein